MWQVRQACAEAIRRCEQAERQTNQMLEAAARQRQAALNDARQKHAQARQGAEALLQHVRSLARQGDSLLADLGLSAAPPRPFVPPAGASLGELTRLLQNQRSEAEEALQRLKATAAALKEERRKWWKFW